MFVWSPPEYLLVDVFEAVKDISVVDPNCLPLAVPQGHVEEAHSATACDIKLRPRPASCLLGKRPPNNNNAISQPRVMSDHGPGRRRLDARKDGYVDSIRLRRGPKGMRRTETSVKAQHLPSVEHSFVENWWKCMIIGPFGGFPRISHAMRNSV